MEARTWLERALEGRNTLAAEDDSAIRVVVEGGKLACIPAEVAGARTGPHDELVHSCGAEVRQQRVRQFARETAAAVLRVNTHFGQVANAGSGEQLGRDSEVSGDFARGPDCSGREADDLPVGVKCEPFKSAFVNDPERRFDCPVLVPGVFGEHRAVEDGDSFDGRPVIPIQFHDFHLFLLWAWL